MLSTCPTQSGKSKPTARMYPEEFTVISELLLLLLAVAVPKVTGTTI